MSKQSLGHGRTEKGIVRALSSEHGLCLFYLVSETLVFAKGIVHALPGGGAWAMPFLFDLVGGGNSSSSNRFKRH